MKIKTRVQLECDRCGTMEEVLCAVAYPAGTVDLDDRDDYEWDVVQRGFEVRVTCPKCPR